MVRSGEASIARLALALGKIHALVDRGDNPAVILNIINRAIAHEVADQQHFIDLLQAILERCDHQLGNRPMNPAPDQDENPFEWIAGEIRDLLGK